jgi:hypothetical protein
MLQTPLSSPILSDEHFQQELPGADEVNCPEDELSFADGLPVVEEIFHLDWANIVLRFEAAFQEVYCKSKKVSFAK